MSYTPSSVFASIGLMKNTGMDLSVINGKTAAFDESPIAASFKDCLTLAEAADVANATLLLTVGGTLLPGMLGTMPTEVATELAAAGYTGTLADATLQQAQKVFPGGDISSFVQNFGKSSGAAGMCNDLFKASKTLAGKAWTDFGPGISKISDIATGGLGRLSQVSGIGLKELGAQLSKLGSMENLADLTKSKTSLNEGYNTLTSATGQALDTKLELPAGMTSAEAQAAQGLADLKNNAGNAVNVAANLLNQGASIVGGLKDKLQTAGLPTVPGTLTEFSGNKFAITKVTEILGTINAPADISKIKVALDMDPTTVMSQASDLLNLTKLVPDMSNFLDTNIYNQLPKMLNGIPGGENITSPKDLGEMLMQFEDVPATDALDEMQNFVDPTMVADLGDILPEPDDPETGITTEDLVGVASGGAVGELLTVATEANDELATTAQGLAILSLLSQIKADLLAAGIGDWTVATMPSGKSITDYKTLIEAQMTSIIISGNDGLMELAGKVGEKFSLAATKLSKQISGLSKMDIDLTSVRTGSKTALISFGRSIADLAKQPGNEKMLVNMCSDSDVGQALKLHIVEKKNLAIMQKFGMNPPNEFKF